MSRPLTRQAVTTWARLVRAHACALAEIEGRLKADGLPALEWYDVLLELETGGALRPRDLRARLLLAQSNLSRLLDRMVAAGVVSRRPCAEDRRGQLVEITSAGRRLRRRMWPVYESGIDAGVGERLEEADLAILAKLLAPLVTSHGELDPQSDGA